MPRFALVAIYFFCGVYVGLFAMAVSHELFLREHMSMAVLIRIASYVWLFETGRSGTEFLIAGARADED